VTDLEQHRFYEDLVRGLRAQGVVCAITSGLACVHFGVAETTKDCDLLCHDGAFPRLLAELSALRVQGRVCHYRGNISPPLDARWHRGGWTSHFQWGDGPEAVTLDVFGRALRGTERWETDLHGLYAGPAVVAEMKRTSRGKDWPFITALGEWLLEMGDPRGWLHIFSAESLARLARVHPCPDDIFNRRPCLQLAVAQDARLAGALLAERELWIQLDKLRIQIYEHALRPYVSAVRKAQIPEPAPLEEQHTVRVRCAQEQLRLSPLIEYGLERHLADALRTVAALVHPDAMRWLPDVKEHFNYLHP
jgi:hypothetical protein